MPCSRAESMVEVRFDEISGASAARAMRDPRVADREQPGDVVAGSLGHQLAGEGRERHSHPGAREDLRDDRPPCGGRGKQRQAADAARHEEAARDRPGLRVAPDPR